MYSFKYNQQDATLYNILYYCWCCTCFGRLLRPSSGAQKLYIQHRVYAKLLPLAVAASKLGIYPMLCVQFLSSWWWAEKPPETCRASKIIKNIVKCCILLVILKKIIRGYGMCRVAKRPTGFCLVGKPKGKKKPLENLDIDGSKLLR